MSTTIPGLPEQFASLPSVQMVPPPAHLIGEVTRMVEDAASQLHPNEQGRFVWIATEKGVNLAIVQKVYQNSHLRVNVAGWVAKEWGQPIAAGMAGTVTW